MHWKLGCIYLKSQNIEKSLYHLEHAVKLGNRDPLYVLWLSNAQNFSGNITVASNLVEEVIEKLPDSAEAWYLKGKYLIEQGEKEEGLKCLDKSY